MINSFNIFTKKFPWNKNIGFPQEIVMNYKNESYRITYRRNSVDSSLVVIIRRMRDAKMVFTGRMPVGTYGIVLEPDTKKPLFLYYLNEFNEKLASKSPTPGGGSVAGLSASLSAALIEMVINLTNDDSLDNNKNELSKKRKEALELIDEDAQSFNMVMDAYKMPKNTDEEKKERKKAIQNGLYKASLTPLDTMKLGLKLMEIARKVIEKGNPHAISDIGVAGYMGISAIKGAYLNVLINTQSIKDKNKAEKLENEANEIISKGEKLLTEIEEITISKIKS